MIKDDRHSLGVMLSIHELMALEAFAMGNGCRADPQRSGNC